MKKISPVQGNLSMWSSLLKFGTVLRSVYFQAEPLSLSDLSAVLC